MELVNDIFSLASELGLDVPESVPEYEALSSIASQIGYDDYSYTPDGNRELYNRLSSMNTSANPGSDYTRQHIQEDDNDDESIVSQSDNSVINNAVEDARGDGDDEASPRSSINDNNRFSKQTSNQDSEHTLMDRSVKKRQYLDNKAKNETAENAGKSLGKSAKESVKDAAADTAKDAVKDAAKTKAVQAAESAAAKKAAEVAAAEATKKVATSALLKNPYFWIILGIIALFVTLIILIEVFVITAFSNQKYGSGEFPYIKMNFSETVVLTVDGESQTMPLDDYVTCVLNGEVGETTLSDDHLKAFAIAIRSNVLYKGGSVGSGTNFQVAKCQSGVTDPGTHLHNIADETSGLVLVTGEGDSAKFHYSEYDELAFNESCGGGESDGIITICQKGVQVPREWLNSHGKSDARIDYLKDNAYHGRGMSQMGSYYLALEKGYDYKDLLSYFYGDAGAYIISLYPPKPSGNVTLAITETPDSATELSEPLETFFASQGTSIQDVNDGLLDAVMKAGPGTRSGVVTAALYTVNILLDYDKRLPYYWGGGTGEATGDSAVSETYGFYPYWGTYNPRWGGTEGNILYEHTGIDCGRYVTWIFLNGGVKTYSSDDEYGPNYGSGQFLYKAHTDRHDVAALDEYVGQPGDVLVSASGGHAILILEYDADSKGYYVAQASGADNDIKVNYASVDYLKSNGNYDVVDMSWYYENQAIENFEQVFNENRKDK